MNSCTESIKILINKYKTTDKDLSRILSFDIKEILAIKDGTKLLGISYDIYINTLINNQTLYFSILYDDNELISIFRSFQINYQKSQMKDRSN